jgi:hypothetical protein
VTIAYHPDFLCDAAFAPVGGGYSTRVRVARSGKRQTSPNRTTPIRTYNVTLNWLKAVDAATWTAFFNSCLGDAIPFYWFSPLRSSKTGAYFMDGSAHKLGNGSAVLFDLPFRDGTLTSVSVNGGAPASGSYTHTAYGYPYAVPTPDTFTFTTAPASDAVLTCTYTSARERIYCAFGDANPAQGASVAGDAFKQAIQYRDGENQSQFVFPLTEVI